MPEGVGYGPQNTASIGKDIHIIGNHCYAYSGLINDASSGSAATTLVKFTTGSYIAKVDCYVFTDHLNGNATFLSVTMNGVIAYKGQYDDSPSKIEGGGPWVSFVIPPYTEFEIKWGSSASRNATLSLTGKIDK